MLAAAGKNMFGEDFEKVTKKHIGEWEHLPVHRTVHITDLLVSWLNLEIGEGGEENCFLSTQLKKNSVSLLKRKSGGKK